jgi:uncharacterized protein YkwD
MRRTATLLKLLIAIQALSLVATQGSWREPVSIGDFHTVVNAIRTRPKAYADRVKQLFKDRRNTAGVHNIFGTTYTDTQVDNLITYFNQENAVNPVALDRGLTAAAYERAEASAAVNQAPNALISTVNTPTHNLLKTNIEKYGVVQNSFAEAQVRSLPGGNSAEVMVLHYMLINANTRNVIRNSKWTKMGVGVHNASNVYYAHLIFAESFSCTKCHLIDQDLERRMGWTAYQVDTFNPPDTDGNLRIGHQANMLKGVVGACLIGVAMRF